MAKVVPRDAIFHFVREHGDGDRAVSWVATQQLALITTEQAQLAGLDRTGIARRLTTGRLHHAHRGVYYVGHPKPLPRAPELAAVLAVGRDAFASHGSAAALWGLVSPRPGDVHVTVVGRHCRSRERLTVHRTDRLAAVDRRTAFGIPATAPARALVDYAAVAAAPELERAVAEAFVRRLVTESELRAAAARAPQPRRRAGAQRVPGSGRRPRVHPLGRRAAAAAARPSRRPPRSRGQCDAGRVRGRLLWRDHRLIVEVDGYGVHGHRMAFERDRRKTLALTAAGFRVIRITWAQLRDEPLLVAVQIARALEH